MSAQTSDAFGNIDVGDPTQQCVLQNIGCGAVAGLTPEDNDWTKNFWSLQGILGVATYRGIVLDKGAKIAGLQQDSAGFQLLSSGLGVRESALYIVEGRTHGGDLYRAATETDSLGDSIVSRSTPRAPAGAAYTISPILAGDNAFARSARHSPAVGLLGRWVNSTPFFSLHQSPPRELVP